VIDAIPEDLVLGYSRGYADRLAHEFSDPPDWRGRRIHILGGSPPKQLEAIRQLTRPTLSADPPADIVGVDWNGLHRGAQFGESGRPTAGTTAVATLTTSPFGGRCVIASPESVSSGKSTGSGPRRHPRTRGYTSSTGPTPTDLEQAACTECGTNVWRTPRGPYVAEYGTGAVCGYCRYECYFTHRHRNNHEEIAGEQSVYIPPA